MTEKEKNINFENTNTTLDYTSEKSLLIKDNSSDFYSSKDNISDDINFNLTNQENDDNYDDISPEEKAKKAKSELQNTYVENNSEIIIESESESENENENENSCSVTTIENIENIEDKINNIIYKFQITTDSIDDNEISHPVNNDNYKFDNEVEDVSLNDQNNTYTQNDADLISENNNDYQIQEFEFDSERFKTDSLYQEYIKTYYPDYYDKEQLLTNSINNIDINQYKSKIYIDIHNQIPKKTNKTEYEIIQKVILDTLEKKNALKKFENEKIHRLRKQQEHVLGKLDENVNQLEPNQIHLNDMNKRKNSQNTFLNQKQYAKLIPALKMPVTPTSNNYNKNIFVKKVSSNNSNLNSNFNKQKSTTNIYLPQQNKLNTQTYKRKLELLRNSQVHEFEFKNVNNNKNDSATSSKNYISDEMKHEINNYNNKVILEKFLKAKNTSHINENSQINQIFLDKNHEKYHANSSDNEKMLYLDDEYMKFQGWINNYIDNVKNQSKNIRNENLQPLPLNLRNKNIRIDSIRQKNKTIFANPNIDYSARKSAPVAQEQNYMKGSSRFIQMKNKKIFD